MCLFIGNLALSTCSESVFFCTEVLNSLALTLAHNPDGESKYIEPKTPREESEWSINCSFKAGFSCKHSIDWVATASCVLPGLEELAFPGLRDGGSAYVCVCFHPTPEREK